MQKHLYIAFLSLLIIIVTAACGNGQRRDFNHLLLKLADSDMTIDSHDWTEISQYLDRNKAHFKEFYKDGNIDTKAVEDYVSDFFAHRRPPKKIRFTFASGNIAFHFYLERSGSMTAYDSKQGDGSFRAAVTALQNALPSNATVDSIGEKGYTDFRKIFDNILNRTGDNDVSILVTDLIYSVKDMEGVNPQRVFADMQGMINAVFKEQVKRKSMVVIRMRGSYNGTYYSYDNSTHTFNGYRPYYIVIVGSNDNIATLTSSPDFHTFAHIEGMRGYEGMCLFTYSGIYSPYASFLLSGSDIRGRFQPVHGQGTQILSLDRLAPDRDSGDIQLALAVDLSHLFIDDAVLTDKANYEVNSDGNVKLKEIRPIRQSDITPAEKKYIGTATHLFILSMEKAEPNEQVTISLLNRLPDWTVNGSTDDDISPDSRSTFGLRYLMQGIYDSYTRNVDGFPHYFSISLHLDK